MIQAFAKTDIGKKRKINQDCVYISTQPVGAFQNLFILADGMGGHKAGDYASWFLTESLACFIGKSKTADVIRVFSSAIDLANSLMHEKAGTIPDLEGMGSTLVMATVDSNLLTCANIGDSRLYVIRHESIDQITVDHSYVEEMVSMGLIERNSEEYRLQKNIITRAVGSDQKVTPDFFDYELLDGDIILMCSDGLSNMVPDSEIVDILKKSCCLEEKAEQLIDAANANGGSDNIAVILIEYREGGDLNA